jgi:hypothetical protein
MRSHLCHALSRVTQHFYAGARAHVRMHARGEWNAYAVARVTTRDSRGN